MALYHVCTVLAPMSVVHPMPLDPFHVHHSLAAYHFSWSLPNFVHQSLPGIMSPLCCVSRCLELINITTCDTTSTAKSWDSQMFWLFT